MNKRFAAECRRSGIVYQTPAPFSPQQNSLAERMNRTLMERARSMLTRKNVDKEWWAEAVNIAAYITNRVLTRRRSIRHRSKLVLVLNQISVIYVCSDRLDSLISTSQSDRNWMPKLIHVYFLATLMTRKRTGYSIS